MFRRGLDFDTKAAYIFLAFNSEKANSIKNVGLELAQNSGMDIVLYDIVSIRNSYLNYLNENSNELDEAENIVEKHR